MADIPLDTFYANNPNIHNPECDNLIAGEVNTVTHRSIALLMPFQVVCIGSVLYYQDFECPTTPVTV